MSVNNLDPEIVHQPTEVNDPPRVEKGAVAKPVHRDALRLQFSYHRMGSVNQVRNMKLEPGPVGEPGMGHEEAFHSSLAKPLREPQHLRRAPFSQGGSVLG